MSIESQKDLDALKRIGRIVKLTLRAMEAALRPGVTTRELDRVGAAVLKQHGARSAPKMVYGFPGEVLVSVNDEAVHGVPGDRVIRPGDLVKLDVTAERDGYMADAAVTVAVDGADDRARRLAACAKSALARAVDVARAGTPINEIGRTVERETRRHGFRVLRDLSGHGIGRTIHEEPSVPNYWHPDLGQPLTEGLVITIEPLVSERSGRCVESGDGWTVRTSDGGWAAHFEHTMVITRGKPILLTA